MVLYGETISLSEKVNRLTKNLGPQSFKITKETVVTCKIISAWACHSRKSQDNIRLIVRQIFFKPTVKDYKTGDTIKLLVIVSYCFTQSQERSCCTALQRPAVLHDDTKSGLIAQHRREWLRCTMTQRAAMLHDVAESGRVARCRRERPRCTMSQRVAALHNVTESGRVAR